MEFGRNRHATIEEMVKSFVCLVRLEVSEAVARHTFARHRNLGRVDPRVADALASSARRRGADPSDWRVSYYDVPITQVLSIEASEDGTTWRAVSDFVDAELALDTEFVDALLAPFEKSEV